MIWLVLICSLLLWKEKVEASNDPKRKNEIYFTFQNSDPETSPIIEIISHGSKTSGHEDDKQKRKIKLRLNDAKLNSLNQQVRLQDKESSFNQQSRLNDDKLNSLNQQLRLQDKESSFNQPLSLKDNGSSLIQQLRLNDKSSLNQNASFEKHFQTDDDVRNDITESEVINYNKYFEILKENPISNQPLRGGDVKNGAENEGKSWANISSWIGEGRPGFQSTGTSEGTSLSEESAQLGILGELQAERKEEVSHSRFKKEVLHGKFADLKQLDYEFRDPVTGSFSFGYRTNDQYREELRTADGATAGTYGFLDPDGKWQRTSFIADRFGYRITSPSQTSPNSGVQEGPYPWKNGQSYLSVISQAINEDLNKGSYSSHEPYDYKDVMQHTSHPNPSIETDFDVPGTAHMKIAPQMYQANKAEDISIPYQSLGSLLKIKDQLSSKLDVWNDLPRPSLEGRPPISYPLPTRSPVLSNKDRNIETITVANLQDTFFNKFPLRKTEYNASPPLNQPSESYSNKVVKWPKVSWPGRVDKILTPVYKDLQGLAGNSNTGNYYKTDSEALSYKKREGKTAKSISSLYLNNFKPHNLDYYNFPTELSMNYNEHNPFYPDIGNIKQGSLLSPPINTIEILPLLPFYHVINTLSSLNPLAGFIYPIKPSKVPYQTPGVFPSYLKGGLPFYNFYPQYVFQTPYHPLFNNPQFTSPLQDQISSQVVTSSENEFPSSHSPDDIDYLLLTDEFKPINGSITNDPDFVDIQSHLNHKNNADAAGDDSNSVVYANKTVLFNESVGALNTSFLVKNQITNSIEGPNNFTIDKTTERPFKLGPPLIRNTVAVLLEEANRDTTDKNDTSEFEDIEHGTNTPEMEVLFPNISDIFSEQFIKKLFHDYLKNQIKYFGA